MKTLVEKRVDDAVENFGSMSLDDLKSLLIDVQKEYLSFHYGYDDEREHEEYCPPDADLMNSKRMLEDLWVIAEALEEQASKESDEDERAYFLERNILILEIYRDMKHEDYSGARSKMKASESMLKNCISWTIHEWIRDAN